MRLFAIAGLIKTQRSADPADISHENFLEVVEADSEAVAVGNFYITHGDNASKIKATDISDRAVQYTVTLMQNAPQPDPQPDPQPEAANLDLEPEPELELSGSTLKQAVYRDDHAVEVVPEHELTPPTKQAKPVYRRR